MENSINKAVGVTSGNIDFQKGERTQFNKHTGRAPGKGSHILVVDDDESIREILSEALEVMGYHVITSQNGIDALSKLKNAFFDLIITDLQMPVMDGLSLACKVKQRLPHMPIILITGQEKEIIEQKAKTRCINSVIFRQRLMEYFSFSVSPENEKKAFLRVLCVSVVKRQYSKPLEDFCC